MGKEETDGCGLVGRALMSNIFKFVNTPFSTVLYDSVFLVLLLQPNA